MIKQNLTIWKTHLWRKICICEKEMLNKNKLKKERKKKTSILRRSTQKHDIFKQNIYYKKSSAKFARTFHIARTILFLTQTLSVKMNLLSISLFSFIFYLLSSLLPLFIVIPKRLFPVFTKTFPSKENPNFSVLLSRHIQ